MTANLAPSTSPALRDSALLPSVAVLAAIPEEELWLQGQLSVHTRRAYKEDVRHFMRTLRITSQDEPRQVSRAAVIAWIQTMDAEDAKPHTVRRRLAALSSLFNHLIEHHAATTNPVSSIKRPKVDRRTGVTKAFRAAQARLLLDAPDDATGEGLRDRAILSVLQAALRRRRWRKHLPAHVFRDGSGTPRKSKTTTGPLKKSSAYPRISILSPKRMPVTCMAS